MQNTLNTKQARNLVHAVIKQKNARVWNTWTNAVEKDLAVDKTKRNLCFAMVGEKFTVADCNWIKFLVGCDKVHTTRNGQYLRLVGVKFEN